MDLCFECDRPADHNHHVIPRSLGGTRTIPLCEACHEKVHGLKAGFYALSRAAHAARHERNATHRAARAVVTEAAKAEMDREDARKFALIREMRSRGMALRAIADHLNEAGETTRAGKKWKHAAIDAILKRADGGKTHHKGNTTTKAERAEFRAKVYPVIHQLRDQGLTLREIAEQLNKDGVPTFKGIPWKHAQVHDYLKRSGYKNGDKAAYYRRCFESLQSLYRKSR